jgi:hypothetical protein
VTGVAKPGATKSGAAAGWWTSLAVAALVVWGGLHGCSPSAGNHATSGGGPAASPAAPTPRPTAPRPAASASATASASASSWYTGSYDPAQFAGQVRVHAKEAGVDPQLVLAILYNEDYKPHDPAVERAWQRLKPDASFGVANMHRAAFDETRPGRPFSARSWDQLPDDPDLAIQAEAWYLHDLAATLPAHRAAALTVDELLALGYNTGPANMRAFARGVPLGPAATSYLGQLHSNWPKAAAALG